MFKGIMFMGHSVYEDDVIIVWRHVHIEHSQPVQYIAH